MLVGYARVSKEDQVLDLQIQALKQAGIDERFIFIEKMTGYVRNRPVLGKLKEFIKPGDTLVVYKLDRLGRSLNNLLEIMEYLKKNNIQFISITEKIETDSAVGRLFFHMMAIIADFERSMLIERTNAGLSAAKLRGVQLGRRKILTNEQKQQVYDFLEQKKSLSYIARVLGLSRTPIRRAIEERATQK